MPVVKRLYYSLTALRITDAGAPNAISVLFPVLPTRFEKAANYSVIDAITWITAAFVCVVKIYLVKKLGTLC